MTSTDEIRGAFLGFFAAHDHEIVPSGPLVPQNDPTLLFTNAGMVPFKSVFTGAEKRPYARAASSQKCVRAGGKHNDLENVGYTARHHTFFEMLGNFSFGDYFKDIAIELAWTLVTKELGLAPERLLVTVFAEDDAAYHLWRRIAGLPEDRIIRIATSDNFWAMGDTGPCGPCSEIFYDHGPDVVGGPPGSADEDGDRFTEIWNLVFMQYEQRGAGTRVDLPRPSIDTGMGLERIAAVLQGKHDVYDTDILRALIEASAEVTDTPPDGPGAVSHRVIADHLRACSFLIADGVMPSNEGRGYVLRRIMRRAMRHAHQLGAGEPVMHRLVPALIAQMGHVYGELVRAAPLITETFKLEEERFRATLGRGLRLLEEETARLGPGGVLPGEIAFRLYDTYGFPLDLTEDILRSQGRSVDHAGFEAAMQRQREAARRAWVGSGEAATETLWFDLRERHGATEFLGYETLTAEARVLALVVEGAAVERIGPSADASANATVNAGMPGQDAIIIVNQTPFYGEAGGQMGDTGVAFTPGGAEFTISDTQRKLGDLHLHVGRLRRGAIQVGDTVELRVDAARRARLRANHSATHLLHEALRRRLGAHVTQKGSLVAPERLRFDFSHSKPVTRAELSAVERLVNQRIEANRPVVTRLMRPDQAVEAGALALFGEKYGEEVRVVSMGDNLAGDDLAGDEVGGNDSGGDESGGKGSGCDGSGERGHFSTELCGGTHVTRTGDIGLFKIVSETAVAAGVRRIEALTGADARAFVEEEEGQLRAAAAVLNVKSAELPARIEALAGERRRLEQQLSELRRKLAMAGDGTAAHGADDITQNAARNINGVHVLLRRIDGMPAKELRSMADALKKQVGSGVVGIVAINAGKASLVVGVTQDLSSRLDAVALVRAGVAALGGKGGGGRADLAQGGGPDVTHADAALAAIAQAVESACQVSGDGADSRAAAGP